MKKKVGVVIPVFNEEASISLYLRAMKSVFEPLSDRMELEYIFVDDGSSDDTLKILKEEQAASVPLTFLSLASNRGQQIAILAGLDYAQTKHKDALIVMDVDLQDPPEVALQLLERVFAGVDIVYAQRQAANGKTWLKKLTSEAFYSVFRRISSLNMPSRTSEFRAISGRALDEIVKYREQQLFIRGIFSHMGFTTEAVSFSRGERVSGNSKYTYKKSFKLAMDGIMGYSTFPLQLISSLGVTISVLTAILAIVLLCFKLFNPIFGIAGWVSTILIISFFSGLQLLTLGIMASYVGRIYIQVLNRPLYALKEEKYYDESPRGIKTSRTFPKATS